MLRKNLPAGSVTHTTFANSDINYSVTDGSTYYNFEVEELDLKPLQQGENSIAIEIHRSALSDMTAGFNLALVSKPAASPQNPGCQILLK